MTARLKTIAAALLCAIALCSCGTTGPSSSDEDGQPQIPARLVTETEKLLKLKRGSLEISTARFVPAGGGAWLVSGGGLTCLISARDKGFGCDRSAKVAKVGVAFGSGWSLRGTGRPERFMTVAVVPEWVTRVRLLVGERTVIARPRDRAFAWYAGQPVLVALLEGEGGRKVEIGS